MANLSTLRYVVSFLFNHSDGRNIKYIRLLHPLLSLASTSSIYMLVIHFYNQFLESQNKMKDFQDSQQRRNLYAFGLIIYVLLMIVSRYTQTRNVVFYEMIWACNMSLMSSAYALITNKPIILAASMIVVSIDQVLWYIDILTYLLFKQFPIGVAKYITWPTTTKLRLFSSFHHILFIPFCLYLLRNQIEIPIEAFKLSTGATLSLSIISRLQNFNIYIDLRNIFEFELIQRIMERHTNQDIKDI
ncbi:hypothetical protein pb186bvf_005419 [Paramecium bursaria]